MGVPVGVMFVLGVEGRGSRFEVIDGRDKVKGCSSWKWASSYTLVSRSESNADIDINYSTWPRFSSYNAYINYSTLPRFSSYYAYINYSTLPRFSYAFHLLKITQDVTVRGSCCYPTCVHVS